MSLIPSFLEKAAVSGVSDIFITAGKIPSVRKNGKLFPANHEVISEECIEDFRRKLLTEKGENDYLRTGSMDTSCVLNTGYRFRINFFRTLAGSSMAVRPIRSGGELSFQKLRLPGILEELCSASRGLILITGSTGSGKSTTLAAMVNSINSRFDRHILTIEDPVEFVHPDKQSLISQREINTDSVSFASALRSALRENPDVIVVGEMRDSETIQTALSAALTGHLVIATVHTSDTIQAVDRLLNFIPGEQRHQAAMDLGSALNAVIAQRLLPLQDGTGMIPALEILIGTPTVKKYVEKQDPESLEDALIRGRESGMIPFNRAIFRLFRDGLVTLEDARKAAGNPDEFDLLVKGMETGSDTFRSRYGDCEDGEFVDMRRLLRTAMSHKASDLLLSAGAPPTVRINGELRPLDLPPLSPGDIQRLLYSIINRTRRIEFEEKRELDLALSVTLETKENGKPVRTVNRFRVNGFFQRGSPGAAARVINTRIPTPEELSLPDALVELTEKKQGLVLVTGPTGSGKSTTLAALIERINQTRRVHIVTIEDPIEFVYDNKSSIIEQRELYSDTLSYSSALKYVLRQDPDVIMVGEMRDTDTISAALTAAETGHLVFATIHTNSAMQTVDRIVDVFPPDRQAQIRMQLSGTLLAVVSQRLLPALDGKGRCAAFEVMTGTPPVLALIRDGKSHQLQSVIETSSRDGMKTLQKSLQELYESGLISQEASVSFGIDYKPPDEYL